MPKAATKHVEDPTVQQVSWSGMDFRQVWSVFPGAKRDPSLDAAFKEGTQVFVFKDAYGVTSYAFISDDGTLRSHGAQHLHESTIEQMMAAGAVLR